MHYFVCMSMIKEPRFGKLLFLPVRVLSSTLSPCCDPRLCNARTCYLLTVHASEPIPHWRGRRGSLGKNSFSASRVRLPSDEPPRQCPSSSSTRSNRTSQRPAIELLPLQSFCSTRHSSVCPRMGLLLSRGLRMIL